MFRPALLLGLFWIALATEARANDEEVFFETRIRPVLVEMCLRCHGGK
jgi:hypothetical protein